MNRHRLHYVDLRPAPAEREPGPIRTVLGAALTVLALWAITAVLFSL
jgi:hypothetical protein